MMRLFIALPLPREAEEELGRIIFLLKQKGGSVKWVTPKNIHLTMKFLGDTEENLVDSINEQIDAIARDFTPVETAITRLGAFPNLSRPRVIWAGLDKNIEVLAEISGKVEAAVESLGFEREERSFKAHLTLGRVRQPAGLGNLTNYIKSLDVPEMSFRMDQLVLFRSTLTPRGPVYDRLHEAVLAKG
ncbi:MAG: RNA 2',3'-cyclic phosphodiesterase [candidate division Zixibacteria bacterium]|nr:RNA 2',3'-cyclic phosphodiesterase [candidate division Zixibacteria bacterium]